MLVVDTNVIVHYWLKSYLNSNAERLLESDAEWIVPFLWRSEFRSVLAFYIRKNLIDTDTALQIINLAETSFIGKEYLIESKEVIELVNTTKCSAYDCEFVCLAKNFNTKLVTSDKQILSEFPNLTIDLKSV
ncbi:MAG: type II toxin-antitoxin system VapC family toxin [Melioribacteraceae bacterium]|nr:type II toxin-antitoxin system VapC family toxin [Melioribacteraceae bacterium]